MRVEVSFDISDNSEQPLGNLKGPLDIPRPQRGDRIDIGRGLPDLHDLGLPADLLVTDVGYFEARGEATWLVQLEMVEVANRDNVKKLADGLEKALDLFCWFYDEDLIDDEDDS